jgi:hypothetical protein
MYKGKTLPWDVVISGMVWLFSPGWGGGGGGVTFHIPLGILPATDGSGWEADPDPYHNLK